MIFVKPSFLTIAIDSEWCVGGGDLVVADLAVLWRTVLVSGLHLQDAVVDLSLCHRSSVLSLPKHGGELIDIVDLNVHHRPADSRGREERLFQLYYTFTETELYQDSSLFYLRRAEVDSRCLGSTLTKTVVFIVRNGKNIYREAY